MSKKRMTDYQHNVRMSMRNLGYDMFANTYFSNTNTTLNQVKDGYKELRSSSSGANTGFKDIKNKIKTFPVYKFMSDMTRKAFEAVKSGKFYQSEDEMFDFASFDDFDYDFGGSSNFDDNFYSDSNGDDVQEGKPVNESQEASSSVESSFKIASTLAKVQGLTSKGSANAITRATIEALFATSQSINNALATVGSDLKGQMITTQKTIESLNVSTKGLAEQLGQTVRLQTDMLSELKMIREMSGDYFLPKINEIDKKESDDTTAFWYRAMKDDKYADSLRDLSGNIFRALDNQASMGLFQQISTAIPLIMMTSGGNPFSLLKTWVLEPFLDKKFGMADFASRVDSSMRNLPDMIDNVARTASLSSNSMIRAIGDGVRTHRGMTRSVATDKYNKANRVFFDGMTKEAIVNVIPTYLSSIVALLSNNERYTYDYDRGVFRSMSDVKNIFLENMPKLRYEYSNVESLLKNNLSDDDKKNMDSERLAKFAQLIVEKLAENSYTLKDFKNHSYSKALETLNLRENELSESDFLKFRAAMDKAEKNESTYLQFQAVDRSLTDYAYKRNRFFRESAGNARKSGLIASLNGSYNMINGAPLAGGVVGANMTEAGLEIPKATARKKENHLLHGYGQVDLGDTSKLGNILGTTYSDDDIKTINNVVERTTGGLKVFMPGMHNKVSLLLQSRLAKKLGVQDKEFYKDFKDKSMYDNELILANIDLVDRILDNKIADDAIGDELKAAGVSDDGVNRVLEIVTDPNKTPEEVRAVVEKEISRAASLNDMQSKLNESLNSLKKKTESKIGGSFKDKASEYKEEAMDSLKNYTQKIKDAYNQASASLSEKLGVAKEKTSDFYANNKGTINNVLKASLGVGAGYAFLKGLSHTGVGKVVGAFGLLSPVALAAGALGAGIYAYKNNIFDRLFGDSDKRSATMKKVTNVVKTGLMGAGGIAGLSFLLSPITGGAFGLMGPAALALSGLAMGIVGELKGVKKAFFGTEEGSFAHNMKLWLFGDKSIGQRGLLTGFGEKLSGWFSKSTKNVKRWFEVDIWKPLTDTFKPISTFMSTASNKLYESITGIPATLEEGLFKNFKTNLAKPLMTKLEESILNPVGSFIKKMTGGIGKLLGGILSAPFKFFRTLITGKTDKDYFVGSYGSTSESAKKNVEYVDNMRAKEELYKETKYMSLNEAKEKYSKKELKQIRKFKATEAMEKANVQEQEEKSLATRLAEYKASKAEEHGQGIPKRFYTSQNSKIVLPEGVSFNFPKYGCGLAVLAMVASTLTGSKIEPEELISEKFGWDNNKYAYGIDPAYMMNVLTELGINVVLAINATTLDVENHIKKGGLVILDMDDLKADTPHYVVIDGVVDDTYFSYSDPAREGNFSSNKELMLAKTKRMIFVFKRKRTLSEKLVNLESSFIERKAQIIATSKDFVNGKRVAVINTYDSLKEALEANKIKATDKFESVKESLNSKIESIKSKFDTDEDKESKYEDGENPYEQKKRTRLSFGEYLDKMASEAKVRRKSYLDESKDKNSMQSLIKINKDILTEVKALRKDNYELLNDVIDTMLDQTNSVPYNLEYIKRVLVKVHGDIPGFGDKDIGKNSKLARAARWLKRKFDGVFGFISKPFKMVFNKIMGIGEKISNAINFVTTFPQRIASGMYKIISSILPSKEFFIGIFTGTQKLVKNLYDATTTVLQSVWNGVKEVTQTTYNGIKSLTKTLITSLGDGLDWVATRTSKALQLGFKGLTKAASWIWDRGTLLAKLAYSKVSDIAGGIFGRTKRAIKDVIAPREVFVLGGHLDGIKTVEVVKAVGAVDLDYAESIHRKLTKDNSDKIIKGIRRKENISNLVKYKSPKFKSGQEYNDISERQDADSGVQIIEGKPVEEKKEEKGFLSKLFSDGLGSVLGSVGGGLASTIVTGLIGALSSFGLYKVMDGVIGDKYADIVNSVGYDGEYNRERVKGVVARPGIKAVVKAGAKVFGSQFMKEYLPKIVAKTKGLRDLVKNKASSMVGKFLKNVDIPKAIATITSKLKQVFTNKKIVSILGDSICGKILKAVPKIAKKAGSYGAKAVAKGTARMAAYGAPPIGVLVDIAFIAYDLISGMTFDADNLVGVNQSDLTLTHRAIAGVVKMLQGFLASKGPLIFLALIPTDWIVQTLIEVISDEDEYAKWEANNKKYLAAKNKDKEKEEAIDVDSVDVSKPQEAQPVLPKTENKPIASPRPSYLGSSSAFSTYDPKANMQLAKDKYGLSDQDAKRLTGFGDVNAENFGGNAKLIESMSNGGFLSSLYSTFKNIVFGSDSSSKSETEDDIVDDNKPVKIDKSKLKKLSDPEYKSKISQMYDYARGNFGEDKAKDLMRISYAESGWIQNIQNPNTMAEGLFQVIPSYRKAWGFKQHEAPGSFEPVEQMKRVAPIIMRNASRGGAQPTLANMYAALHYPVAVGKDPNWVLYGKTKDPKAYAYNKGVDYDKDGNVTYSELARFVSNNGRRADAYAKELGLQGYGEMEMISQNSMKYNKLSMGSILSFKDAGCGPAVMAMLLDKLGIRYNMQDLVSKAQSMKTNELSGTPMTFFKDVLREVGINSAIYTDNIVARFIAELRKGNSPILLTETTTGSSHYIIGKGLDKKRIIINDPLSTKSESVFVTDRRIRNAKAILVYFTPNTSTVITNDILTGGYGLLDDLNRTISNAPRELIGKLEQQAVSSISRNSKFNVVDRLAKDILSRNTRSLGSLVGQVTNPINQGIGAVNGIQNQINGTINGVLNQGRQLADLPARAINELTNRTLGGITRELGNVTREINGAVSSVAGIGKQIENVKQSISLDPIASGVSTAVVTKMASDLSDIKKLMEQLVKAVTSGVQLKHNNKPVATTVGGRPVPALLGESASKSWLDTIDAITRGK